MVNARLKYFSHGGAKVLLIYSRNLPLLCHKLRFANKQTPGSNISHEIKEHKGLIEKRLRAMILNFAFHASNKRRRRRKKDNAPVLDNRLQQLIPAEVMTLVL